MLGFSNGGTPKGPSGTTHGIVMFKIHFRRSWNTDEWKHSFDQKSKQHFTTTKGSKFKAEKAITAKCYRFIDYPCNRQYAHSLQKKSATATCFTEMFLVIQSHQKSANVKQYLRLSLPHINLFFAFYTEPQLLLLVIIFTNRTRILKSSMQENYRKLQWWGCVLPFLWYDDALSLSLAIFQVNLH